MTLTLSEPAPKKPRKAKPALSAEALQGWIARIEELNNDLHREALVAEIEAAGGTVKEHSNGVTALVLAGLSAQTTGGLSNLLAAWCSKARLAILHGKAV